MLEDFRATSYDKGFDDLLVWFEGESFQVPLHKNGNKGNCFSSFRDRIPVEGGVSTATIPCRMNLGS